MAYLDILFPPDISFGGRRTPRFRTNVVIAKSGHEQRNRDWAYPLIRWDFELDSWNEDRRAELADFLEVVEGRCDTFRFLDHRDYYTGGDIDDLDEFTAGEPMPFAAGDGERVAFQLRKSRSAGAKTAWRKITKPDPETFTVYVGGVEVEEFELDAATGVVTFDTAPADGAEIAWAGKFWIEARLDIDDVAEIFESFNTGQFSGLSIIEVRR